MAIVKKYKAEVVSIINPIDNVFTVEFKSLNGSFKYLPGQFMHLALDEYDPSLGWPESRCFSMQTSPQNSTIKITFATKGIFTKRMSTELQVGRVIDIKLPYGELFQQEHSKENVVFIAGGTGITPFLSVFTDETFMNYKNARLYFGVRERKYHIYQKDIELAFQINSTFKVFIKNQDIDGVLNIDEIYKNCDSSSIYFISGPQLMISKFKNLLYSFGVPLSNIKTDDWE